MNFVALSSRIKGGMMSSAIGLMLGDATIEEK